MKHSPDKKSVASAPETETPRLTRAQLNDLRARDWQVVITEAGRAAIAIATRLTEPQRRELRHLAVEPQHCCGTSTVRLHNTLRSLGLARKSDGPCRMEYSEITEEGRAVLAAGAPSSPTPAAAKGRGIRRERTGGENR